MAGKIGPRWHCGNAETVVADMRQKLWAALGEPKNLIQEGAGMADIVAGCVFLCLTGSIFSVDIPAIKAAERGVIAVGEIA